MKLKFLISLFFIVIIFSPAKSQAELGHFFSLASFAKSTYSFSSEKYKEIKKEKRGTYLPGVFDSNTPRFSALAQNANQKIAKKKEEDRLKRLAKLQSLGVVGPAFDGKYIDIDLASQTLTAFDGGEAVYRFKISSGKRGMTTPTGTYSILNKIPRPYSKRYNLYMPYWMAFRWDGYGLHELPEWSNGAKEGEAHLGIPVSHGCVRLGVGSAAALYSWTEVGDLVYIH